MKDEVIVFKGEVGDCMFVVLLGEVGVYFDDDARICTLKLNENKQFGARALQHDDVRTATVKALKDTICLSLNKLDFYE